MIFLMAVYMIYKYSKRFRFAPSFNKKIFQPCLYTMDRDSIYGLDLSSKYLYIQIIEKIVAFFLGYYCILLMVYVCWKNKQCDWLTWFFPCHCLLGLLWATFYSKWCRLLEKKEIDDNFWSKFNNSGHSEAE